MDHTNETKHNVLGVARCPVTTQTQGSQFLLCVPKPKLSSDEEDSLANLRAKHAHNEAARAVARATVPSDASQAIIFAQGEEAALQGYFVLGSALSSGPAKEEGLKASKALTPKPTERKILDPQPRTQNTLDSVSVQRRMEVEQRLDALDAQLLQKEKRVAQLECTLASHAQNARGSTDSGVHAQKVLMSHFGLDASQARDIYIVQEQVGVTPERAVAAFRKSNGDLTQTVLMLVDLGEVASTSPARKLKVDSDGDRVRVTHG